MAYSHSGVQLLHEGCEGFRKEFETVAGLDPMEKFLTIASACNLYNRIVLIQNNTIASEPIRGWHGKEKQYSQAAMEWLCHQNREMSSGSSGTADRIAHARNYGEHVIRVGAKQIYVDGCVETSNTVCEFSVCFYHGCTTCFPNCDQKHAKFDDRIVRNVSENTQTRANLPRQAGCLGDTSRNLTRPSLGGVRMP